MRSPVRTVILAGLCLPLAACLLPWSPSDVPDAGLACFSPAGGQAPASGSSITIDGQVTRADGTAKDLTAQLVRFPTAGEQFFSFFTPMGWMGCLLGATWTACSDDTKPLPLDPQGAFSFGEPESDRHGLLGDRSYGVGVGAPAQDGLAGAWTMETVGLSEQQVHLPALSLWEPQVVAALGCTIALGVGAPPTFTCMQQDSVGLEVVDAQGKSLWSSGVEGFDARVLEDAAEGGGRKARSWSFRPKGWRGPGSSARPATRWRCR